MSHVTIATVITENGISRCISATPSSEPGTSDLRITGVTERAASEISALVIAAMLARCIQLPDRAITVDLVFDVPFEETSELALAAYISIVETIWSADENLDLRIGQVRSPHVQAEASGKSNQDG